MDSLVTVGKCFEGSVQLWTKVTTSNSFSAGRVTMSNLNLNILVQSVEGLAQQLEKSNASLQQDKTALIKAKALLEGLKGMYGIDTITMDSSDVISIVIGISGYTTKMVLDPMQSLKLISVKVC